MYINGELDMSSRFFHGRRYTAGLRFMRCVMKAVNLKSLSVSHRWTYSSKLSYIRQEGRYMKRMLLLFVSALEQITLNLKDEMSSQDSYERKCKF